MPLMNDTHSKPGAIEDAAQAARREFLQKAGKLAAYTPPIMLALMYPGAHAIASVCGQDCQGNQDQGGDSQ
jgi:formiminotetrahydrofolate cyclodeaminase